MLKKASLHLRTASPTTNEAISGGEFWDTCASRIFSGHQALFRVSTSLVFGYVDSHLYEWDDGL